MVNSSWLAREVFIWPSIITTTLAGLELSFNVGETAASASLASVIMVSAGALFMTGVGAYAMRNNLIGA